MSYEILQANVEFKDNQIERVTVLVNCTSDHHPDIKPYSDVRAITASNKPTGGYMNIHTSAQLSEQLLQRVAGGGMQVNDRDKIFPNWKQKLNLK